MGQNGGDYGQMRYLSALLAVWIIAAASVANTAEFTRTDPSERPRGMSVGAFHLAPAIEVRSTHDDNIFREPTGGTSSLIQRIAPQLTLRSGWRRHSFSLIAGATAGRFLSSPDDDFIDLGLLAEGVVDVTRATRARLRLTLDRGHEARGSDDAPLGLAAPVRLLRLGAELTGQYDPGRLRLQPSIGVERVDFQDTALRNGLTGDQDDRDRDLIRLGLLVGWRLVGRSELFAEGRFTNTDFHDPVDRGGFDRDNQALRVLGGARLNLTRLIAGRIAAGYERRRQNDPALRNVSGPVVEAALTWSPSRLITFDLTASRRVSETTILQAAAVDETVLHLRGVWAIRRHIDLTAEAGVERQAFRGIRRTDRTIRLGLGAAWQVTRAARLEAGFLHVHERSSAAGEGHRSNQVWLGARYAF